MSPRCSVLLTFTLAACAHTQQARTTGATPAAAVAPPAGSLASANRGTTGDAVPASPPIYFDFDEALLSRSAEGELGPIGDYLSAHPTARLTISGNTDERGTVEYNLALGDRRAQAARDYLTRLGIDRARIKTVSYGELRPAQPGHDEAAWAKNRRDELDLAPGAEKRASK